MYVCAGCQHRAVLQSHSVLPGLQAIAAERPADGAHPAPWSHTCRQLLPQGLCVCVCVCVCICVYNYVCVCVEVTLPPPWSSSKVPWSVGAQGLTPGSHFANMPDAWHDRFSAPRCGFSAWAGDGMSACCDWVRQQVTSAASVPVWQHVNLSQLIHFRNALRLMMGHSATTLQQHEIMFTSGLYFLFIIKTKCSVEESRLPV